MSELQFDLHLVSFAIGNTCPLVEEPFLMYLPRYYVPQNKVCLKFYSILREELLF